MDVLLSLCVFVTLVMASRIHPQYRLAWVAGQWLALAQALLLLTMR